MTFFLGTKGNVRLRRGSKAQFGFLTDQIIPADINTSLNRLSFDGANDNLLTGDRVSITTEDARGLVCFPASTWLDNTINKGVSLYVNVNAVGGLRFFRSFEGSINNNRANEVPLQAFTGDPIVISVRVFDVSANILGNVIGFEFNTDRETIDTTAMSDKFRQQFSAGVISGAGRIDCVFDYQTSGVTETPLLALQLIQRVDIGSEFDLALYLTDKTVDPNVTTVFYDISAMVSKAGIRVSAGDIIECSIDFVTTGEIRLLVGKPSEYILREDDETIQVEQTLGYLLQETED